MDERISVGTSFGNGWFITAVVIAVGGAFAGLSLIAFHPGPATVILGVAAVFVLIAMAKGFAIARGRKWVTPTDDGFVYEDRRGEFEFRDEDVVELGTWARTRFSNGVPKSILRDCLMVLSAGDFRGDLQFSFSFPVDKLDPLAEFLERNLDRLVKEATERIDKGDALVGDTWELDKKELVFTDKRRSEAFGAEELSAADVVDNKVCVWIRGEPKPVVQVPASSLNALVMLRVLGKRFEARGTKPDDDEPGLGRIIFERDNSTSTGLCVFAVVVGALMFLGGCVAAFFATQERNPTGPIVLAAILVLLGPGIAVAVWFNRISILRCHSRGVARITTKMTKELEYKEVRVFSYQAIRQYVNGGYTGTTVTMTFEPAEGSNRDTIHYSATMKKIDVELDNLRDHVSGVIAKHMKDRLDEGKTVRWTDGLRFTPEGLELELAGGRLSAGKSRLLAYEKCTFTLQDGYFFLFKKGGQDSLYSLPVSAPNFFPGYALLHQLVYPPRPKEDEEEDVPTIKPKRKSVEDPDE